MIPRHPRPRWRSGWVAEARRRVDLDRFRDDPDGADPAPDLPGHGFLFADPDGASADGAPRGDTPRAVSRPDPAPSDAPRGDAGGGFPGIPGPARAGSGGTGGAP